MEQEYKPEVREYSVVYTERKEIKNQLEQLTAQVSQLKTADDFSPYNTINS